MEPPKKKKKVNEFEEFYEEPLEDEWELDEDEFEDESWEEEWEDEDWEEEEEW